MGWREGIASVHTATFCGVMVLAGVRDACEAGVRERTAHQERHFRIPDDPPFRVIELSRESVKAGETSAVK